MKTVKECSCGRSYSLAEWKALPSLGRQYVDVGASFDLRNCGDCGSTMALDAGIVDALEIVDAPMSPALLLDLADVFEREAMQTTNTAREESLGMFAEHEVSVSDDDALHLRREATRMRRDAEEQASGVFPSSFPLESALLDEADADTEIFTFEALQRAVG